MAKNSFYAWISPNGAGICNSWEECQAACSGQRKEKHKGFATFEEAWAFAYPNTPLTTTIPEQNKKNSAGSSDLKDDESFAEKIPLISTDMMVTDDVNEYCKNFGFDFLSEQQRKAVQSIDGKTLLFAVPGSGKTTVIIARTGYMVFAKHIRPSSIMSLTFTKAAAREMSIRYKEHFKTEHAPDFRTIHSLCYSIILPKLRSQGFSYPSKLLGVDTESDEEETNKRITVSRVYRELFKSIKCHISDFETAMNAAQCVITGIKNSVMYPDEYETRTIKIDGNEVNVEKLFNTYQNILQTNDCMDYDDLLIHAYKGLKKLPSVASSLREKYRYWSVDEAQDNSKLQFMLFYLLCGNDGNIFMVGDDDQSIYGFRGSNPKHLIAFGSRSDVNVLLMGDNYRSDKDIVNTSREFIAFNNNRADKELHAFSTRSGHVFVPKILMSEAEQYSFVINAAKKTMEESSTLAVLYRRNVSSLPLIAYMHKNNIPYEANKGIKEILQEKHIKVLWRLLDYINSSHSLKAFNACRGYLQVFLSAEEMKDLRNTYREESAESVLDYIQRKYIKSEEFISNICNVNSFLTRIRDMKPTDAVKIIMKDVYIIAAESINDRLRLYSFLSACDLYETIGDFVNDMHSIIANEKKLSEEEDPSDIEHNSIVVTDSKPLITLSTIHSSKGREFDRVIIVDSFDEIMPGQQREDTLIYDPEEERRLFYVAVTRAAHRLDLISVDKYHGNSEKISRFIGEYAFLCEQVCDFVDVLNNTAKENVIESGKYLIEPQKFYAVRVGRKPGIYTTWSECQEQVVRFSGAEYKSFLVKEEAEEYIAYSDIPQKAVLNLSAIKKYIISSEGVAFNFPMDLPEAVNNAVHNYFNVADIQKLGIGKLKELRSSTNFIYSKDGPTDYRNITESYMLIYMPVNFYKVWKPLSQLAVSNLLHNKCKILELGAGPGTATLGLMSFYNALAKTNPEVSFELEIVAVEREAGFKQIFNHLTNSYKRTCQNNLNVSIEFICGDALEYCTNYGGNYDLILESNMLNPSEDTSSIAIEGFMNTINVAIGAEGYVVFVEPGKKENRAFLNKLVSTAEANHVYKVREKPSLLATDISQISLYNEVVSAGLRGVKKTEHWFSYTIIEKERR